MTHSLEQPSNLPPTYKRDQESLWIEIRKLWKGVRNAGSNRDYEQPFSLPGVIYVSESGPWVLPNFGGRLTHAVAGLSTAGTTSTIVQVRKNGVVITGGSITLASGQTQVFNRSMDEFFSPNTDIVTVACTQAGSGAEGLTVQLRFKMG